MNTHSLKQQLIAAKGASVALAALSSKERAALVRTVGMAAQRHTDDILAANERDVQKQLQNGNTNNDRLLLDEKRVAGLLAAAEAVAKQADVLGQELYRHTIMAADGTRKALKVRKVTVPFGVIGMIYESRPNVTFDAAIMALKSGNAIVLRGGSEAYETNRAIVAAVHEALQSFGLDAAVVTLLGADRALVHGLLTAHGLIDMVIPRGSQQLIDMVRRIATVPVVETGAGVCHTYVASDANLDDAARIIVNAKTQRPTVCNALDTIIVDEQVAGALAARLAPLFRDHRVAVWADERSWSHWNARHYDLLHKATNAEFGREFLDYACAIKTVANIDEALAHIKQYSSKHTEVIISQNASLIARFVQEIDAAVVVSNASSRFTDGGQFGLGAEVGISTQKLHARGPFGIEKLVTEKWIVAGDDHIRQ
jgi:glutamate-5-semialdehyde dehydrogenase